MGLDDPTARSATHTPSAAGGRPCRIAVTSWGDQRDDRSTVEVNQAFVDGVRRANATPLVTPVLDPAEAADLIELFDGILISGGVDVDPAAYGAHRNPHVTRVDPARDRFEIGLVEAAIDTGRPVLGLCRGAQVLNVACGGTLVQHLPQVSIMAHERREHPERTAHEVTCAPGSIVSEIFGRETIGVNSLHHQAVDELGESLVATAHAEDGTIEAIECRTRRLLGVQWHPELMLDHPDRHDRLFVWLVDEARRAGAR